MKTLLFLKYWQFTDHPFTRVFIFWQLNLISSITTTSAEHIHM